jgi:hypothetical protein
MRALTAIAVLLAVVGTALVGVREKSETTRLRYRVAELERRRDVLERQVREVRSAAASALAPRGLLEEHDRLVELGRASGVHTTAGWPEDTTDLAEAIETAAEGVTDREAP